MIYEDSYELMKDSVFRGRVGVACTKFASYIADELPSEPAMQTLANPDSAVVQVMPTVVWDAAVQADGSDITDQALQPAVETAVQKLI